MVEHGLGISILPELILKRIPYRIVAKPLDVPGNWACTAKPEKRIPYSETLSELLGVPETTLFPISISMQPCHSIQLPCPYWYDN